MVWTTIITGIGGLLVMVASMLALREHLWLRNAQVTEGTVAELIAVRGSKGTTYKPRVSYTAQDGNVHEFVRRFSSSPPGFSVGEKVPVAYDARSYEGRILTFGQRFGLSVILAAVGMCLVATSAAFVVGKQLVPRIYMK